MDHLDSNLPADPLLDYGRRKFWMWSLIVLLLLAQGFAIITLLLSLVLGGGPEWWPTPTTPTTLVFVLAGLAFVLGRLMIHKQRALHLLYRRQQQIRSHDDSLRSRLLELSSLFEAVLEANLQVELDAMLGVVTKRVLTCLDADQSSIMLIDRDTGDLQCRAVSGIEAEFARGARTRVGEGVSGWVAERNQVLLLNQDDMERRFPSEIKSERSIVSAICVPLSLQGQVIGVFNVNRLGARSHFKQSEAELLALFASHITIAIRRNEELQTLGCRAVHLEETNIQLKQGNQQLRELTDMKSMFLNVVNQELRVPLASIINCAESIAQTKPTPEPEQSAMLARILGQRAIQLRKLINDLVELSLLDRGLVSLTFNTTSLNRIVDETLEAVQQKLSVIGAVTHKNLDTELPLMSLDQAKLIQVLSRLISNLASETQMESHSEVEFRLTTRRRPESALLAVSLSGMSLPLKSLGTDSYGTGANPGAKDQASQGIRLSLELVRKVVERHGGSVQLEDNPRGGCHIILQFPLRRDESPPRPMGSREFPEGPMDQVA